MKFFEILMTFLQQGGSMIKENAKGMERRITNDARKVVRLLAFVALAIALFCTGFNMAFHSMVQSLQMADGIWFTAPLLAGLALALGSAGLLAYSLSEKSWQRALQGDVPPPSASADRPPPPASPLESAIAVLLMEGATELRERRYRRQAETPPSSTTDEPGTPL